MIVDSHAHVWDMDSDAFPWQPSFSYVPPFAASSEELLDAMARLAVDYAILVQPSIYGYDHRFLFDAVERHRDRFLPLGLVDPARPDAPTELASLLEQGCVGVRVNLSLDTEEAAAQMAHDVWARLESLGVPVCVRATPAHHDLVMTIMTRFPRLQVVIDHLELPVPGGWGEAIERVADLAGHEHCVLKVAGLARLSHGSLPFRDLWPVVEAAFELFGPYRLVWGSDFPGADSDYSYVDQLDAIQAMPFISAADRRIVMSETPRRLWGEPAR
jgi:L-fuconolactonase